MKKYTLSNQHIDDAIADIAAFLGSSGVTSRDAVRIRLAAEEVLLKYQEIYGTEKEYLLDAGKKLGKRRIIMTVPGESRDPFVGEDDEMQSEVLRLTLAEMGVAPTWQYKSGKNYITFTPQKKKRSQIVNLIGAIIAALVFGFACRFLPAAAKTALAEQIVTPVFDTFLGILSAIAGPLIFLSVTWGIYSIGDVATLGKIGKKMVGHFLAMMTIITLVGGALMTPFYKIGSGSEVSIGFSAIFEMLLGIIPGNFLTPFTEGNPLQIIFLAVAVGLAMLVLSSRTTVAATVVEQANYIVQFMMEIISSLIPIFVFISIFNMVINDRISSILGAYKLLLLVILGEIIGMLIYAVLVCFGKKVAPSVLISKIMPAFLIGLTTASATATFAENVATCERKMGISTRMVNFGVPLGQVVFMPASGILFFGVGMYMAETYGVVITPAWMLVAFILSLILAVAAPPIPGGTLTCYTILFLQLGIPTEAIAVAVALNVVLEFVATAVNVFFLQSELIIIADSLDELNKHILRTDNAGSKKKA